VNEPDSLLAALRALYARVDALYAEARCPQSTECCRFGITGREPQVTSIELALLSRAVGRLGGMRAVRAGKRRALPIGDDAAKERTCPLLVTPGRCAVYADRPLGCRTFFCQRAEQPYPPSREELRDVVKTLQALAARHARDGDRPRALSRALAAD
jgi:Fe-S-cluster containining protein